MQGLRRTIVVAALVAVPLCTVQEAGAASARRGAEGPADARWLPWFGCWQPRAEHEGRTPHAEGGVEAPDLPTVCLAASGDGVGAVLTVRAGGDLLVERTLVADGSRQEAGLGECRGWERRDWSADGRRLFTRGEVRCDGEAAVRRTSGVSLLSSPSTWVDIELVDRGARQTLDIRRYGPLRAPGEANAVRPPPPGRIPEARRAGAAPLTLPDVREAIALAAPPVVEAMLSETRPRVRIDRDTLIELDDAGVDGDVIDLLVAFAFPERFIAEPRGAAAESGASLGVPAETPLWSGVFHPFCLVDYGLYLQDLSVDYGISVNDFEVGRRYDPALYFGGPQPDLYCYGHPFGRGCVFNAPDPGPSARAGGAVKGSGYARVRPRTAVERPEATGPPGGSSGDRRASSAARGGAASSAGGATARGRSDADSRGGGATPAGYGNGGAARDDSASGGGRTAVPRP